MVVRFMFMFKQDDLIIFEAGQLVYEGLIILLTIMYVEILKQVTWCTKDKRIIIIILSNSTFIP